MAGPGRVGIMGPSGLEPLTPAHTPELARWNRCEKHARCTHVRCSTTLISKHKRPLLGPSASLLNPIHSV